MKVKYYIRYLAGNQHWNIVTDSSLFVSIEVIDKYRQKISSLEKDVNDIMKQEEEEKQLAKAENYLNKVRGWLNGSSIRDENGLIIWDVHQNIIGNYGALSLQPDKKLTNTQR